MSNYDNETYLQALNASRGDVERQMANTLAEIQRQRGFGDTRAQGVPAATQSAFNVAESAFNGDLGEVNRMAGMNLQLPEIAQAMRTHQAGFAEASPLLRQGFGEQATQRTGSANAIGQQLYSQIDQQRAEYISRREEEDRQRAFAEQQAAAERAFAAEQQRLALEAQARLAAQARAGAGGGGQAPAGGPPIPNFVPGSAGGRPAPWSSWQGFAQANPELANMTLWFAGGDMTTAIAEARKNQWMTPQQVARGPM